MPGINDKSQAQGWHVHNARLGAEQEERDGLRPKRLTRREPPARPVDPELAAEYALETGAVPRFTVVDTSGTAGVYALDDFDLGIAPPRRVAVARYLALDATPGVIPWRLLTRAEVEQATHHADARVRTRARRQLHRIDHPKKTKTRRTP